MERFDAIVIGGGPAGSTCAYKLAKAGAKVLVVDSKKQIGKPVQCAEFVPIQLFHQFEEFFPREAIAQKVSHMIHYTPWNQTVSMWSEGFVLHREVFDLNIAQLAVKEGAKYLLRTIFLGIEDDKVLLENISTRERFSLKADVIVGADGPRSKVAKLTGRHTRSFLVAAQYTVKLKQKLEDLVIYFRDYIPGGYGWIFPKQEWANVGVGIDPDYPYNLTDVLKRFVNEVTSDGWVDETVVKKTGGWIPADGLLDVRRDRVLLIGDAGGFCHPITGGGIANAILSGHACAKAVIEGDLEAFQEYAYDTFGVTLWKAAQKRKLYMKNWENLKEIIPKTWIAFREYWDAP